MNEIGRSAVQGDHLNRGAQQPLQGRLDGELGRASVAGGSVAKRTPTSTSLSGRASPRATLPKR